MKTFSVSWSVSNPMRSDDEPFEVDVLAPQAASSVGPPTARSAASPLPSRKLRRVSF